MKKELDLFGEPASPVKRMRERGTRGETAVVPRLVRRLGMKKRNGKLILKWQEKQGTPCPYNRHGEGAKFKNGWKWRQRTIPAGRPEILRRTQREIQTGEGVYYF